MGNESSHHTCPPCSSHDASSHGAPSQHAPSAHRVPSTHGTHHALSPMQHKVLHDDHTNNATNFCSVNISKDQSVKFTEPIILEMGTHDSFVLHVYGSGSCNMLPIGHVESDHHMDNYVHSLRTSQNVSNVAGERILLWHAQTATTKQHVVGSTPLYNLPAFGVGSPCASSE